MRRHKAARTPDSIRRPLRVEALSDAWRAWVAENALLGVQREVLLDTLAGQGVPRAVALRELEAILSSPILRGARRAARRARRYQLLERLERETALLASTPMAVERRSRLSADELYERYYASGTPVVITDVLADRCAQFCVTSSITPCVKFERRVTKFDTLGRHIEELSDAGER